jgi:hypothetical protein
MTYELISKKDIVAFLYLRMLFCLLRVLQPRSAWKF